MKVLILTEGGKDIGFGHIARCIALYQAFEEKGVIPELIINGDEYIEEIVSGKNYQAFNWLKERDKLFEMVNNADIAIIDSYLADISLYAKVSKIAKVPVYIDDTKRLDYPRCVVLNASIYANNLDYPKKDGVKYLLGIQYAFLRKEFWEVPEKEINENIESIMVTFGGIDAEDMTSRILSFLNENYSELQKYVVIGKGFQNINTIEMKTDKKTGLIYFPTAEKMKEVMLTTDIAISSGGQTLYELIRVGVPTIGICVAEDQIRGLKEIQKMELIEYIGLHNDDKNTMKLKKSINHLKSQKIRETRSKRGRTFVDGKGSKRVITQLLSYL